MGVTADLACLDFSRVCSCSPASPHLPASLPFIPPHQLCSCRYTGSVPTGRAHAHQMAAGRDWLVAPLGSRSVPQVLLGAGRAAGKKPRGLRWGAGVLEGPCPRSRGQTVAVHTHSGVCWPLTPGDRMAGQPGPGCPPALPARAGRREGVRPRGGEEGESSGQQAGEVVLPLPTEALCTATWPSPLWSLCGAGQDGTGPQGPPSWWSWPPLGSLGGGLDQPPWSGPHSLLCPEEGKDQWQMWGWILARQQLPRRKLPLPHPLGALTLQTQETASVGLADAGRAAAPRLGRFELGRAAVLLGLAS